MIDLAEYPHGDDQYSGTGINRCDNEIGPENGTMPSWLQGHTKDPCQYRIYNDGDGNDVTYTAKLSDWGNLGSDTPDPPAGVTTLVSRTPPAIPGDPNDTPWTDVTALWGAGIQPTQAPFDLATSTVTIELWQEG